MMDFKKRALILSLAATISVTGSFAADNYKNCLMDLEFKAVGANEINLVLNTKRPYTEAVVPVKKDASTFVIMLPETDNQSSTPNLSDAANCIESVEVRKMPYSEGHKGYTKILIKTSEPISLNASTALYVPSKETKEITKRSLEPNGESKAPQRNANNSSSSTPKNAYRNGKIENRDSSASTSAQQKRQISDSNSGNINQTPKEQDNSDATSAEVNSTPDSIDDIDSENTSYQQYMLGLLVLFIIITSIYFYIKAQDKLANVMGEKLQIDVNEDTKDEQKKNKNSVKIRKTINKLDEMYSKTASNSINTILAPKDSSQNKEDSQEELNIVDLDALFKEKQSEKSSDSEISQEESDALDDFLSGFSFDDTEIQPKEEEEETSLGYDEEEYEKLLNSKGITFSKADIDCFNALLASEISDSTMSNLNKYAVSNPIADNKPSKNSVLEKIVTDYTVFQNITFNSDDINILKKLISVELDPDFLSDLRTNSERTSEMEKEIISPKTDKKKPSEILTLNVKELLPNLSEALRKQGNKPIKSEAKPETVYFSEGYEVSTLSADLDLPNLAKEIKNRKAHAFTPSAAVQTVDSSYADSVQKLSISGLPDLEDVTAHPEKYAEEKTEAFVADESALLSSIMNVQFKPFDDGTRSFEIINNDIEEKTEESSPSIDDIRNEFRQFDNFNVADSENLENFDSNSLDGVNDGANEEANEEVNEEPNKVVTEEINEEVYQGLIKEATEKINEEAAQEIYQEANEAASEDSEENNKEETISVVQEPIYTEDTNKIPEPEIIIRRSKSEPDKIKNLKRKAEQQSEELMNRIEKLRAERQSRKAAAALSAQTAKPNKVVSAEISPQPPSIVKCIIDGVNYDIVDSVSVTENTGCYLAKSDKGYAVLAYKNSEICKIKEYDSLKVEKISVRQNTMADKDVPQYLIKIGTNKFLAELIDEKLNYVMDL